MPRTAARTEARRREAGFTLVEILVALLIIAILVVVMIRAFGGAKGATYAQEGKTVGSAYMQAVSQYHADFANRHPATWTGNNTTAAQQGPRNLTNQPYMKTVPESVTAGRTGVSVGVAANCGTGSAPTAPSGAAAHTSWVAVCFGAEPRYFVKVFARKSAGAGWGVADAGKVCFMGATTATPKC